MGGFVGEVARREEMRQNMARRPPGAPGLGQMGLDERPVPTGEFGEGMQGLAGSSPAGPSRSGSSSQGYHGNFAGSQRSLTGGANLGRNRGRSCVPTEDIAGFDVFDPAVGTEAILGQADATFPQV